MPEAIKSACDICGQIYRLSEERLGRSTSCKVCGTKFTVEEFVPPREEEEEEHDSPWPWIKGGFTLMLMLAILIALGRLPFVKPEPRIETAKPGDRIATPRMMHEQAAKNAPAAILKPEISRKRPVLLKEDPPDNPDEAEAPFNPDELFNPARPNRSEVGLDSIDPESERLRNEAQRLDRERMERRRQMFERTHKQPQR